MPPNTSVPIPQKLAKAECDRCQPGPSLLIGPLRPVSTSAVFEVTDAPVVIRAFGLKVMPEARVTLEMRYKECGEEVFEEVCCDGQAIRLSASNNVRTLEATGFYRVVLTGAEPDDITVTQLETTVGTGLGLGMYAAKG